MKRMQPGRRLIAGALTVGLTVVGISLTPAAAASGPGPSPKQAAAAPLAEVRLDRTVSASSALPGYPATNSVDGNQATYWESANNAFPQWIQADLGSARAVARIVLKLPTTWEARTQTLAVRGSTNGSTFTDLAAATGYAFTPAGNTVTIPVAATTRYVRLHITANTGWPAAQLAEFELYGPDSGDTQPPTAPAELTLTEPSAGQIRLTWTASTDNVGVTGYVVYRNDMPVQTVAGTTFTETQPASANLAYVVRARDAAGNESAPSNRVSRTGQQAGDNLAAGKPIEASSTVHTFVAANANDGDTGTYWE